MVNLVDVTSFGAEAPEFLVAGWTEAEVEIARARALYLAGVTDVETFERDVERALFTDRFSWL